MTLPDFALRYIRAFSTRTRSHQTLKDTAPAPPHAPPAPPQTPPAPPQTPPAPPHTPCYLLAARLGESSTRAFIDGATRGAFEIFDLSREHLPRIGELMHKYAKLPMDLADASLVILARQLGTGRILSTD